MAQSSRAPPQSSAAEFAGRRQLPVVYLGAAGMDRGRDPRLSPPVHRSVRGGGWHDAAPVGLPDESPAPRASTVRPQQPAPRAAPPRVSSYIPACLAEPGLAARFCESLNPPLFAAAG